MLPQQLGHLGSNLQQVIGGSVCVFDFTGIASASYTEAYRQKRQNCLSIMKKFGFGQRLMETRINSEVSELINQARLIDGKPFDPKDVLHMCVVNVITSILFGQRFEFDDPRLKELVHLNHEAISNYVAEVEVFPILRFVPPFRQRLAKSVKSFRTLIAALQYRVS